MGAAEEKLLGNDHLRAGRLESARDCYSRALETCEEPAEVAALHCNRALAELKLGQHTKCVADCDAAIAMQPRYGKAFFRRAQAREELEKMQEALDDMKKVVEIDPSVAEARRAVPRLQMAAEKKAEELKEQMMGQLKELGNSLLGKFGMSLDNFKAEKDPNTGSYNISFGQ